MKKIFLLFFIFTIFFPLFVFAQNATEIKTSYEKARVISVENIIEKSDSEVISKQKIKLKLLSGEHKKEIKEIENEVSSNPLSIKITANDKLLIYIEENDDNSYSVQIQSFYILPTLIFLIILFLLTIVVIGGKQGIKAIISLIVSIFLIFKIFIPKALLGTNPLLLTLIISSLITTVTFLLISGFNKKTASSILGTIGGVITATLLAVLFSNFTHLTGLADEHARALFANYPHLDFKGLLLSGIIIGSLGAVMDVAMSISSTISEVKKAQPNIKTTKLIKSGMNVGRDIMGTMSNTLIFAYVGSSLFLLLLFAQYGESYTKFLNFNFIAEEVIRSIAGSIGLILSIPLTAIIASYLENKIDISENYSR